MQRVLVTGGAGFIGTALVRRLLTVTDAHVLSLDKLTYAANLSPSGVSTAGLRYTFECVDVCDGPALDAVLEGFRPTGIVHLAAETHVDRSIEGPERFIATNVLGTHRLLEATLRYWRKMPAAEQPRFRLLHVSTDEVYGSLGREGLFDEASRYAPNSPYAASKAAADHLVRSWHATYGLPTIVSHGSNTYGMCQYPEKLIPLMTLKGLAGKAMPIYGNGENIRNWLHVDDHAHALHRVLVDGKVDHSYNIGGSVEMTNLDVVRRICGHLDRIRPSGAPHEKLMLFVEDRPGHDFRYALDTGKIERELGWHPIIEFDTGLLQTVEWYTANQAHWTPALKGRHGAETMA